MKTLAFTAGFGVVSALLQLPEVVHAQTAQDSAERKTVTTPTMRERVYSVLSQAQKKAEENLTSEAITTLDRLQDRGGLNSYEVAMMWKSYASLYFSQDNYDGAIQAYQNLLDQRDLPEALETEALYSLGQLYFVREDYKSAIELFERWFKKVTNPAPKAYVFLAQAYYQIEEFGKALKPAREAVAVLENQGEVPREDWYMLLRAVHFELNDYTAMARVLEKLVKHYPKKSYWMQLSDVYGELKQADKRLSALEIAYRQNLLSEEKELIKLAQLLLRAGVPYKAARVLEKGMKNGSISENEDNLLLLSSAWSMAQEAEKSLPALIRAANLSNTGELEVRLGQTYFQLDQWEQAVAFIRKGLEKGELGQADNAYLLLGLSFYNLDRLNEAIDSFRQAANYDDSIDEARRWIQYLEKEKQRREQLARN
ncbi:CDC27 family protein [Marinobacter sp. chi1]|uniref:CDC27 family protein n=1 Tax=Marinobacter suaedae TaxID=3057675 RepID=A0ABT8W1M4_9GAMM|nr:tetratricopeptide repeat protein [Marinobacter sp. chi1]MDO3722149.1 CDC27 family protein [Marinobacter sp. chi1]